MAPRAVTARDAGLALISRINRWTVAGAIGATGLISIGAANAFHGRAVGQTHSSSASGQPQQPAPAPSDPGAGSDGSGLEQPSSAPSPAPSAPSGPVVSGGS